MVTSFRKHISCRIIALIVAIAFIWQSAGPIVEVNAQAAGAALTSKSLLAHNNIDITALKLPASFGEITDSYKGALDKTVIHIRDAHCDYSAQNSISGIIGYFRDTYGIDLIALEGGSGDYDLSVFTDIKDAGLREKVADYFVRHGEVNGAELYAINHPLAVTLYGVEDPSIYMENLNAYRDSLVFKDDAHKLLNSLARVISQLKSRIYPEDIKTLDKKLRLFNEDKLSFEEYAALIAEFAGKHNIDLSGYPNIKKFYEVIGHEKGLNIKETERERNILIDLLNKRLSKKYLEELIVKTVAFNDETISAAEFYQYLLDKASLCGIETDNMPNLLKYAETTRRTAAVNKRGLEKEFKELEGKICGIFFKTEDQKQLCALDKKLFILERMFSATLTKEGWDNYCADPDDFDIKNYESFLQKKCIEHGIPFTVNSADLARLNDYRKDMEKFFAFSLKRDDVFINKIAIKLKKENQKNIILVTGGFHQDNLKKLFQNKGYSYVEVLPRMAAQDGSCPYFRLLSGGADPITRAIMESQSTLQIATFLDSNLGSSAHGNDDVEAFKEAVRVLKDLLEKQTALSGNIEFSFSPGKGKPLIVNGEQVIVNGRQVYTISRTGREKDTVTQPAPGVVATRTYSATFDKFGQTIRDQVADDATILFLPYLWENKPDKFNKEEFLEYLRTDKLLEYRYFADGTRMFLKVIEFADGTKKFFVLASEAKHITNLNRPAGKTIGYHRCSLQAAGNIIKYGFYQLPERWTFTPESEYGTAMEFMDWDLVIAFDLNNNDLIEDKTPDGATTQYAFDMDTCESGARLPDELRKELERTSKGRSNENPILVGDETGFLVHLGTQMINIEKTLEANREKIGLKAYEELKKKPKRQVLEGLLIALQHAPAVPPAPAAAAVTTSAPAGGDNSMDAIMRALELNKNTHTAERLVLLVKSFALVDNTADRARIVSFIGETLKALLTNNPQFLKEFSRKIDEDEELGEYVLGDNRYIDSVIEPRWSEDNNGYKKSFEIFTSKRELKKLLFILSIVRLAYDQYISDDSDMAPLAYARDNGLIFEYSDFIKISPVTESFRRHILIIKNDNKTEERILEIKIPGERKDKAEVGDKDFIVSSEAWQAYGSEKDGPGVVKVVAWAKADGEFRVYDKTIKGGSFALYEYGIEGNGMRVEKNRKGTNFFILIEDRRLRKVLAEARKRPGRTDYRNNLLNKEFSEFELKDLQRSIVVQTMKIVKRLLDLGYRGYDEEGSDLHMENFCLLSDGRVASVADFGAFTKIEKGETIMRKEKRDTIRSLVEGMLDAWELDFNELYQEVDIELSTTSGREEPPAAVPLQVASPAQAAATAPVPTAAPTIQKAALASETPGEPFAQAEALLREIATERNYFNISSKIYELVKLVEKLSPERRMALFRNILINSYSLGTTKIPVMKFMPEISSPWEQTLGVFTFWHQCQSPEDIPYLVRLLSDNTVPEASKSYIWELLDKLSTDYTDNVVRNLNTQGYTSEWLVENAMNLHGNKKIRISIYLILRDILGSPSMSEESKKAYAALIIKRADWYLRNSRGDFDTQLIENALLIVEPDTRFEAKGWRRLFAKKFNVRNEYVQQIKAINEIFQRAYNLIVSNPLLTYEECCQSLMTEDDASEILSNLTKKQKVLIKLALINFFSHRYRIQNEFKDACARYPIKEFTEASERLIELNKEKKKLERSKDIKKIRAKHEEILHHLDKMEALKGQLAPYFKERFAIDRDDMPALAKIRLGPFSIEIEVDYNSLQKYANPANKKGIEKSNEEFGIPSFDQILGISLQNKVLDLEKLQQIINRFPNYLYGNFQNEMVAYLTGAELRFSNFENMMDAYRKYYENALLRILGKHKEIDLEDAAIKVKVTEMIRRMWAGPEWARVKSRLRAIKKLIDDMVDAKATLLLDGMKLKDPNADIKKLEKQAYNDAGRYVMGLFQLIPLLKINRLTSILDEMRAEIAHKRLKTLKEVVPRSQTSNYDEQEFAVAGLQRGDFQLSMIDGGARVFDHETQHLIYGLYTGAEARRFTADSGDFWEILNKALNNIRSTTTEQPVIPVTAATVQSPPIVSANGLNTLHSLFRVKILNFLTYLVHETGHILTYIAFHLFDSGLTWKIIAKAYTTGKFDRPKIDIGWRSAIISLAGPIADAIVSAVSLYFGIEMFANSCSLFIYTASILMFLVSVTFAIDMIINLSPANAESDLSHALRSIRDIGTAPGIRQRIADLDVYIPDLVLKELFDRYRHSKEPAKEVEKLLRSVDRNRLNEQMLDLTPALLSDEVHDDAKLDMARNAVDALQGRQFIDVTPVSVTTTIPPNDIIGAAHNNRGLRNARLIFRLARRKQKNADQFMHDWARDLEQRNQAKRQADEQLLRDVLKAIGFSTAEIDGLLGKIILCDLKDIAGGDARAEERLRKLMDKRDDRIGGLIITADEGNRILFLRERVTDKQFHGDLLHEIVETALVSRGLNEDVAHQQAMRIQDIFRKRGAERAQIELRKLYDRFLSARQERTFENALSAALEKAGNLNGNDISVITPEQMGLLIDKFIEEMTATGWRGPPEFARIAKRLLSARNIASFRKKHGTFDAGDLTFILQRLHTLALNLSSYGVRENVFLNQTDIDRFIRLFPFSSALLMRMLETRSLAGDEWDAIVPDQAIINAITRGDSEYIVEMIHGKLLNRILPQLKAIIERMEINITEMEKAYLLEQLREVQLRYGPIELMTPEVQTQVLTALAARLANRLLIDISMILPISEVLNRALKLNIRVERILGRGFDGIVLLATRDGGRKIVVKINMPQNGFTAQEMEPILNDVIQKIKDEDRARLFARHDFPAMLIPTIDENGRRQDVVVEISEFVNGDTVKDMISGDGLVLSLQQTADLIQQFIIIHRFLYMRELINRDVRNLNNLIVEPSGKVRFIDFGNVVPIDLQAEKARADEKRFNGKDITIEEARRMVLDFARKTLILSLVRILTGQQFADNFEGELNIDGMKELFIERFGRGHEGFGNELFAFLDSAWSDAAVDIPAILQRFDEIAARQGIRLSPPQLDGIVGAAHEPGPAAAAAKESSKDDALVSSVLEKAGFGKEWGQVPFNDALVERWRAAKTAQDRNDIIKEIQAELKGKTVEQARPVLKTICEFFGINPRHMEEVYILHMAERLGSEGQKGDELVRSLADIFTKHFVDNGLMMILKACDVLGDEVVIGGFISRRFDSMVFKGRTKNREDRAVKINIPHASRGLVLSSEEINGNLKLIKSSTANNNMFANIYDVYNIPGAEGNAVGIIEIDEFVEGVPLSSYVADSVSGAKAKMPPKDIIDMLKEFLQAHQFLYKEHSLIAEDADNIDNAMLTPKRQVRIIDFGRIFLFSKLAMMRKTEGLTKESIDKLENGIARRKLVIAAIWMLTGKRLNEEESKNMRLNFTALVKDPIYKLELPESTKAALVKFLYDSWFNEEMNVGIMYDKLEAALKEAEIEAALGLEPEQPVIDQRPRLRKEVPVVGAILNAIRTKGGRITFKEFMDISLYGPGGYYSSGARIGHTLEGKDFITFPETLSPHFGGAVAKQIYDMWQKMGCPDEFIVIEMGAGNGTLAHDILAEIEKNHKDLFAVLKYRIIDKNTGLVKEKQKDMLKMHGNEGTGKIELVEGSAIEDLHKVGTVRNGIFLSNELVDAFPVHRVKVEMVDDRPVFREAYVRYNAAEKMLEEEWGELSTPGIMDYVRMVFSGKTDKQITSSMGDRELAVNLDMLRWIEGVSAQLEKGYVITIDYGFPFETLQRESSVRVISKGKAHNDAKLAFTEPGSSDMTSDVYFGAVRIKGNAIGLMDSSGKPPVLSQSGFLSRLGVPQEVLKRHPSHSYYVLIQSKGDVPPASKLIGVSESQVPEPPTGAAAAAAPPLSVPPVVVSRPSQIKGEGLVCPAGTGLDSYSKVAENIRSRQTVAAISGMQNTVFRGQEYRIFVSGAVPKDENGKEISELSSSSSLTNEQSEARRLLVERLQVANSVMHTLGIEGAKKAIREIMKATNAGVRKEHISYTISAFVLNQLEQETEKSFRDELGIDPKTTLEEFLRQKVILDVILDYKKEEGKETVFLMPYFEATNAGLARLNLIGLLATLNFNNADCREARDSFYRAISLLSNLSYEEVSRVVDELLTASNQNPIDFFKNYKFRIAVPPVAKINLKELQNALGAMAEVWRSL